MEKFSNDCFHEKFPMKWHTFSGCWSSSSVAVSTRFNRANNIFDRAMLKRSPKALMAGWGWVQTPPPKKRGRGVVRSTPYHLDMSDGPVIKAWVTSPRRLEWAKTKLTTEKPS